MSATQFYTGDKGEEYHRRRTRARSHRNQGERARHFADLASDGCVVLDFGCGTGGMLSQLPAARRIGVEINPVAAAEARQVLDEVHGDLDAVPDESVDLLVSNHAMEHVEHPAAMLRQFHRVLKPGGRLRIAVPCEMPILQPKHRKWSPGDPDMHINSWTPLTLGNLITTCGFDVQTGEIRPDSAGGRFGRHFSPDGRVRNMLARVKARLDGAYHTVVTARRP